jgi:ATP:ADP antiporter, AAA family
MLIENDSRRSEADDSKGLVEKLLSPIADVHRGEAAGVLLMTLVMFLTLAAYYLLKTAREVFILSEGGAEVKSYSAAGQALLLLVLIPAYGAFASRVNRTLLLRWVTLFFVSNIFLFFFANAAGLHIGIPYFLWVGIFNVMVIAQYWAFANDIYTQEQGKRLFPIIGLGASLGAWAGAVRAGALVNSLGPRRLLLSGAMLLVICVVLIEVLGRRPQRNESRAEAADAGKPLGKEGGFQLIFKDRYLQLIAVLTVLLNVVNTSGEYLFGRYVVQTAKALYGSAPGAEALREHFIGSSYSQLFSAVNLVGLLLQMFVVSRIFKRLGVGKALFIHPLVAGFGYLCMLRAPSLALMHWLKVADNSLDYSLENTTKQALWLPTSREAKYKAKQAVDSFFMRAGDVIMAGVVYTGERLAFSVPGFAALNVVLVGAWLSVAALLNLNLKQKASEGKAAI